MNLNDVNYDAFISYRHSEKDIFVATTLQRKLETYRLPRSLRSRCNGKAGIERVFRDQDELPLASNLSDPINEALKHSNFLLVICTPRLPESKWCQKEIETFMALHGRDHILLVLAEGEPSESFPDILLHGTEEITDADGNTKTVTREFEPLAADVRGASPKEIRKKIDDAVLRISAAIFGLNYDDLKQRNRERRIRRLGAIWGSIGAAMFIVTVVCAVMLFQISRQKATIENQYEVISRHSEEIETKNREILSQNEEITKQKEELQLQYNEAARKYSLSMADASAGLMSNGRRTDALFAIRSSLPDSLNDDDTGKVYTAAAHSALVDALALYDSGTIFFPMSYIESDKGIFDFIMSDTSGYLAIRTMDFSLLVYDVLEDRLLFDSSENPAYANITEYCFLNDALLCFKASDMYNVVDMTDTSFTFHLEDYVEAVASCPEQDLLFTFISDGNYISAKSLSDFSTIWNYDISEYLNEDRTFFSDMSFLVSPDGNKLYFFTGDTDSNNGMFLGINTVNGELFFKVTDLEFYNYLMTASDNLFFIGAYSSEDDCGVCAIDTDNGEFLWYDDDLQKDIEELGRVRALHYNYAADSLIVEYQRGFICYDAKSGVRTGIQTYESPILCLWTDSTGVFSGDAYVIVIDEKGRIHSFLCGTNFDCIIDEETHLVPVQKKLENAVCSLYGIFLHPADENYIIMTCSMNNDDATVFGRTDKNFVSTADGRYQLCDGYTLYSDQHFYIVNSETGETNAIENNAYDCFLIGEDGEHLLTISYDSIELLNTQTLKCQKSLSLIDTGETFINYFLSDNKRYLALITGHEDNFHLTLYSTESLEPIESMDILYDPSDMIMISEDKQIYAVLSLYNNNIKLIKWGETEAYAEKELFLPSIHSVILSSDGRYLLLYYNNKTEIYETEKLSLVKTLYDTIKDPLRFTYYPGIDTYIVSNENKCQLLNSSLDSYTRIKCYAGFNPKTNSILINNDVSISSIPYYDYETLIQKTDALLEQFECSEDIKNKYNIN